MDNVFAHSGDLGDIIYALPTIRACGGGRLNLFHTPGKTAHGMSQARADRIIPLLDLQPYMTSSRFVTHCSDHSINGFRHHRGGNIADRHLFTMGQSWREREVAWLNVDYAIDQFSIVFCRSRRYRNPRFPWKRIYENYVRFDNGICNTCFVGHAEEYQEFIANVGTVAFADCTDLLMVARYIAGCRLYVGNYTAATAIAEGMKKDMILEVYPQDHMLAMFHRMNCLHGWDDMIELPKL